MHMKKSQSKFILTGYKYKLLSLTLKLNNQKIDRSTKANK